MKTPSSHPCWGYKPYIISLEGSSILHASHQYFLLAQPSKLVYLILNYINHLLPRYCSGVLLGSWFCPCPTTPWLILNVTARKILSNRKFNVSSITFSGAFRSLLKCHLVSEAFQDHFIQRTTPPTSTGAFTTIVLITVWHTMSLFGKFTILFIFCLSPVEYKLHGN